MARVTHKSTFEKRHIKYGGIEIDKLEEEHFERQIVIEFGLGAMHFWKQKWIMKLFFSNFVSDIVGYFKSRWHNGEKAFFKNITSKK